MKLDHQQLPGLNCQEEHVKSSKIMTILASEGVEFLISGEAKVPLSSIDGKMICLFFSANWCRPCKSFTSQLLHVYNTLRATEENLEIIFISFDRDESGFQEHFKCMPWLAVPFDRNLHRRLSEFFHVDRIPSLIPLSTDGLIEEDATALVEDYGAEAFPFTKMRKEELKAIDNAKFEGGKLEELLACKEPSYLISRDDRKTLVSKLVEKTIGLYFGAHWCPPCRVFTTRLVEAYNELQTNPNQCFEIIFVSTDRDHDEFNLSLSNMPWLAIPFEDKTRQDLCRIFNIQGIPALVLIGPDGKTITPNGRPLISLYGAKAFPFTASRISELQAALTKEGDSLPHQVKDPKHEHVLKLEMAKAYVCDSCKGQAKFWAFSCDVCDYDLHPSCVEEILNGD